jgi:hypothetical protein
VASSFNPSSSLINFFLSFSFIPTKQKEHICYNFVIALVPYFIIFTL